MFTQKLKISIIQMKDLFFVFIGGGLGSILRYLVGLVLPKVEHGFPWSTFIVNILGSFLIGIFYALLLHPNSKFTHHHSTLLIIGLCGGFTTFSALSFECFQMIQQQQYVHLFIYLLLSICMGLVAVYLGYTICK
jgi:CrcB protein